MGKLSIKRRIIAALKVILGGDIIDISRHPEYKQKQDVNITIDWDKAEWGKNWLELPVYTGDKLDTALEFSFFAFPKRDVEIVLYSHKPNKPKVKLFKFENLEKLKQTIKDDGPLIRFLRKYGPEDFKAVNLDIKWPPEGKENFLKVFDEILESSQKLPTPAQDESKDNVKQLRPQTASIKKKV